MALELNSSNSNQFFSQTPQLQNSMELPTPWSCSANGGGVSEHLFSYSRTGQNRSRRGVGVKLPAIATDYTTRTVFLSIRSASHTRVRPTPPPSLSLSPRIRLSSPSTPSPTFSLVEKRRRSPPSPTLTLEEKGKKDASISAGEEGEEGDVKPPAVPSKRTRGFLATRRPRPLPPPPHLACGYRTSPAEPTSIQIQGNSSVFSPRPRPLPLPSGTGLHLVSFVNHRQDALTG